MKTISRLSAWRRSLHYPAPIGIGLLLCMSSATFATTPAGGAASDVASAQARYDKERARCLSGTSGQEQATCLKEAGAALDLAKRNQMKDAPGTPYDKNAADRCGALPAADQPDCLSRARGEGQSSGSVKGGGVIRETVTIVPGAAASAPKP